ncbi:GFA family protein [Henriciella mobilis]|nr:GFA family protein [Henriciella mobilis]
MQAQGGCQCGAVRFSVDGPVHFSAVCHCPSCRKSAGAPLVGWAMFDTAALTVDRPAVSVHASSPGVRRSFCGTCGTTLFFEADYMPGLVDITTESFDNPDDVRPTDQIWTRHETACVRALAGMPRHESLPPQA